MRPDRLYLADIVAASDAIGRFIADMEDDSDFFQVQRILGALSPE